MAVEYRYFCEEVNAARSQRIFYVATEMDMYLFMKKEFKMNPYFYDIVFVGLIEEKIFNSTMD